LLWVRADYRDRLEAARRDPPGIVFLGDSCTEFSRYPERTSALVAPRFPSLARGFDGGTGGWSSQQGRWALERDLLALRPRVVTIYFGWNDHWVALGPRDEDARPGRLAFFLSQHSRWAQLVEKVVAGRAIDPAERPNRVDRVRYRENLEAMAREAQ